MRGVLPLLIVGIGLATVSVSCSPEAPPDLVPDALGPSPPDLVLDPLEEPVLREPDAAIGKEATDSFATAEAPATGSRVTASRLWQCPKCGKLLAKQGLGKVWNVGDPISRVAGTATCGNCMSRFDQKDVYSGLYDVHEKARQGSVAEFDGTVSVLAYRLFSTTPPADAEQICSDLLETRYPKAELGSFYIVGRTDSLTVDEALTQYKEYVEEGQLPDLGSQFDAFEGKDSTGSSVVVLYFRTVPPPREEEHSQPSTRHSDGRSSALE